VRFYTYPRACDLNFEEIFIGVVNKVIA
jgi:hypothetical protein